MAPRFASVLCVSMAASCWRRCRASRMSACAGSRVGSARPWSSPKWWPARPILPARARACCAPRAQGVAPHVVQLVGRDPGAMGLAARRAEQAGADIIDINMGCPAKRVAGGLAGSALMRDLDHALAHRRGRRRRGRRPGHAENAPRLGRKQSERRRTRAARRGGRRRYGQRARAHALPVLQRPGRLGGGACGRRRRRDSRRRQRRLRRSRGRHGDAGALGRQGADGRPRGDRRALAGGGNLPRARGQGRRSDSPPRARARRPRSSISTLCSACSAAMPACAMRANIFPPMRKRPAPRRRTGWRWSPAEDADAARRLLAEAFGRIRTRSGGVNSRPETPTDQSGGFRRFRCGCSTLCRSRSSRSTRAGTFATSITPPNISSIWGARCCSAPASTTSCRSARRCSISSRRRSRPMRRSAATNSTSPRRAPGSAAWSTLSSRRCLKATAAWCFCCKNGQLLKKWTGR